MMTTSRFTNILEFLQEPSSEIKRLTYGYVDGPIMSLPLFMKCRNQTNTRMWRCTHVKLHVQSDLKYWVCALFIWVILILRNTPIYAIRPLLYADHSYFEFDSLILEIFLDINISLRLNYPRNLSDSS